LPDGLAARWYTFRMEFSDEMMREELQKAKSYTLVLLRQTDKKKEPGMEKVIWEHARRNMMLRAEGKLSIVCPIRDESDLSGAGIFHLTPEETRFVMDGDPGVVAGIFTYEIHETRSFPGDALPA